MRRHASAMLSALRPRLHAVEAVLAISVLAVGIGLVLSVGVACIVVGAVWFTFCMWGDRIT